MLTRPIRTLEDFRDTGRAIHAYCSHDYHCSHDAPLRLEVLAVHVGWRFDFYQGKDYLAARLRCSLCGWYYPTFALGHAGKRPAFSGTHGAGTTLLSTQELVDLQRTREKNMAGDLPWVGKRKGGRKFGQ